MPEFTLPPLPYDNWVETRDTLHLFMQILGKIRLKAHPKLNHWWHVTLYPSARGLSTGRIPYVDASFEIDFDMIDHKVIISRNDGRQRDFDVADLTVAEFYHETMKSLSDLDIGVEIYAVPYDNKSAVPFAEDTAARAYNPSAVAAFRQALCWIAGVFEQFRSRFNGKQTPVHLYWHSFDLVVTRFSGNSHPLEGGTASDKEAYSHEVISVGFWPGDDSYPKAAFYGYAYPEPDGLADVPLAPPSARWAEKNGGALAVFDYDDLLSDAEPREALLAFLEAVYQGAGKKADWPLESFRHTFSEEY